LAAAAREPACRLLYLLIGVFLFNPFEAMLPCDLNENHTFWGRFVLAWISSATPTTTSSTMCADSPR
jgi:hypothetical protein